MRKSSLVLFVITSICLVFISCDRRRMQERTINKRLNEYFDKNDGSKDFDFLAGKKWRVKNKVLSQRLSNNNDWTEFEAEFSDYQKIAGGFGNVDQIKGNRNGVEFAASSIRIFNKNTQEWSIYWVDNIVTQLVYQVTGKFQDGVGEFFGEEPFNGGMAKLRFIWKDITATSAHWEQAYYDSLNNEWETNWVMEFEAIEQ